MEEMVKTIYCMQYYKKFIQEEMEEIEKIEEVSHKSSKYTNKECKVY